jgi:hypothetical protein
MTPQELDQKYKDFLREHFTIALMDSQYFPTFRLIFQEAYVRGVLDERKKHEIQSMDNRGDSSATKS